jgi:hypothetical protein
MPSRGPRPFSFIAWRNANGQGNVAIQSQANLRKYGFWVDALSLEPCDEQRNYENGRLDDPPPWKPRIDSERYAC